LLTGKKILWLDKNPKSVDRVARNFVDLAAAAQNEERPLVDFVADHAEALDRLPSDYDLVITRWGHGEGSAGDASVAVSLLRGIRRRDIESP
jgi:hypothetical protein